jgi:hypothetical protein
MKVINLFAGPGAGKSTLAYGVSYFLKKKGVKVEYVHEEAKELVWEERAKTLECQPYIFSKQMRNLWRLKGKVDVVVTDSPILLSLLYEKPGMFPKSFSKYVIDQFNEFDNLNFFLRRRKTYNSIGRVQTAKEALELDANLADLLVKNDIKIAFMSGPRDNDDNAAVKNVLRYLD